MKKIQRRSRRRIVAPKNCMFCKEKKEPWFSDVEVLGRFTSERGKIVSRERSGLCAKHQRKLTISIKRARYLAMMPFVVRM